MKKFLLGVIAAGWAVAAQASAVASLSCSGTQPVVTISFSAGADAGKPGLLWVGALDQSQTIGAVMTLSGAWATYEGGLYPPARRFDAGLPQGATLTVPVPPPAGYASTTNTAHLVGYSIYVGHGALTAAAQQQIAARRAFLNSVKAQRVAAGTWSAEYDSDDRFAWSLVQKDMVDGGKWAAALTIPSIECDPFHGGRGS